MVPAFGPKAVLCAVCSEMGNPALISLIAEALLCIIGRNIIKIKTHKATLTSLIAIFDGLDHRPKEKNGWHEKKPENLMLSNQW